MVDNDQHGKKTAAVGAALFGLPVGLSLGWRCSTTPWLASCSD